MTRKQLLEARHQADIQLMRRMICLGLDLLIVAVAGFWLLASLFWPVIIYAFTRLARYERRERQRIDQWLPLGSWTADPDDHITPISIPMPEHVLAAASP